MSLFSKIFAICISFAFVHLAYSDGPMIASADLILAGGSTIIGSINFTQNQVGGSVQIFGNIISFPSQTPSSYWFHIHQYGTIENNCSACGGHYNPTGGTHGGPWNATRHNGDLGNINVTSNGRVDFSDSLTNNHIQLTGPHSIVGRTLVLHAGTDDYGLNGSSSESSITGNAGARYACGIIGVVSDFNQLGSAETLSNNFKIYTLIAIFAVVKNFFV